MIKFTFLPENKTEKLCFIAEDGRMDEEPRFIYTDKQLKINKDIIILGSIPESYCCNVSEMFYNEDSKGGFSEDDMSHEHKNVVEEIVEQGIEATEGNTYEF